MLEVEKRDASNSDFMTSASIELGMHINETHFSLIQWAAYIYVANFWYTNHFSARYTRLYPMSQISLLRGRIWWCEAWNCRLQQPLQQSNESTPDLFSQSTLTCASSSSPRSRGLPIRAINISNRRCKLSSGRKFWVKEVETNWIELYLEPPSINDLLDLIKHAYSTCVYVTNSCSNLNQKTLGISYFKILFNQTSPRDQWIDQAHTLTSHVQYDIL